MTTKEPVPGSGFQRFLCWLGLGALHPHLHGQRALLPRFMVALICGLGYGVATGFGIPTLLREIIPAVFEGHQLSPLSLLFYCSLPILVMAVRAVCGFVNTYLMAYCGQQVLENMRQRLFEHIQALPLSTLQRHNPGDLIARAMQDSQLMRNLLVQVAEDVIKQPLTLLSALGFLIYLSAVNQHVAYLLLFILSVPLCIWPIRVLGRKVANKAQAFMNQQADLTQGLSQNLSALYEIRAFGLEARESARFKSAGAEFSRRYLKVVLYQGFLSPAIEVIAACGIALTLYYSYHQHITEATFIPLIIALYLCYEPVKKLGRLHNRLSEGQSALGRIDQILAEPQTIAEPTNPVPFPADSQAIEFAQVGFAYTDKPVLNGIEVRIPAHQVTALVGPSGAGKSTFCNLIPRFFEATEGRVKIGGIDIRDFSIAELRRHISIVPQSPVLFNDTVYQNILVGNLNATQQQVMEAARLAHADRFIDALPEGYQSPCGERGERLSGGQRQRIAIARAILKNAPILILDEATSALDNESEAVIKKAIATLMQGKTVLVIAHRYSSIQGADQLLVFDNGNLVEQGSHQALLKRKGRYYDLYHASSLALS